VTSLTPADVKRWDPDAIHGVFQTANNRASTLQRLGNNAATYGYERVGDSWVYVGRG
jgi:hypothetical protein